MSDTVETQPIDARTLSAELSHLGMSKLPNGVVVYEIGGPMFFGAVEKFERALLETHTLPRVLILRLERVPFMDITGIQTLDEVIVELRKKKVEVMLCEANETVRMKLENAGVLNERMRDRYFASLAQAIKHAAAGQSDASAQPLRTEGVARDI